MHFFLKAISEEAFRWVSVRCVTRVKPRGGKGRRSEKETNRTLSKRPWVTPQEREGDQRWLGTPLCGECGAGNATSVTSLILTVPGSLVPRCPFYRWGC